MTPELTVVAMRDPPVRLCPDGLRTASAGQSTATAACDSRKSAFGLGYSSPLWKHQAPVGIGVVVLADALGLILASINLVVQFQYARLAGNRLTSDPWWKRALCRMSSWRGRLSPKQELGLVWKSGDVGRRRLVGAWLLRVRGSDVDLLLLAERDVEVGGAAEGHTGNIDTLRLAARIR